VLGSIQSISNVLQGVCVVFQFSHDEAVLRSAGGLSGGELFLTSVALVACCPSSCAEIPPGKYVSQGLVRICPQGFYRENWVDFDAAVGTLCLPCRPGITTDGAGAGLASLCNRVLPGYGLSQIDEVASPEAVPALPSSNTTGGLPEATVCDIGSYSIGGYCAACPDYTVTRVKGAKSIEECSEYHAPTLASF
jgi:hypothetical protein